MLLTTHLLATLLLSKVLSLENAELYTAIVAGVGVDLDHLFVNKKWIQDVKDFVREKKITYGVNQHSWFQEVFFGGVSGILIGLCLSYFFNIRWWVPPVFLEVHILLDSVMKNEHQPFIPFSRYKYWGFVRSGTFLEFLISVFGLFVIYFLF